MNFIQKYKKTILTSDTTRKSASFILAVFLFNFLILNTFAQESDTQSSDTIASANQSLTSDSTSLGQQPSDTAETSVVNDSEPTTPTETTESPQSENVGSEEQIAPESMQNMSFAQSSQGTDQTAADVFNSKNMSFDGSFVYRYPVKVPPGRNNLQPDLTVTFNGSNASTDNLFGYGWSVNIPHVVRLNKTGIEDMYASSTFYSSLSGELVQIGTTTEYRAKVDQGDMVKYQFQNNIWKATDKFGKVYTFGSTTSDRQDHATNTAMIYKWMVSDIRDTNDNFIKFTYYKETGQIYPVSIVYTGSGLIDGPFAVDFTRTATSVNSVEYDTGFPATTTYQISRIETKVSGNWVRRYDFAYVAGDNNKRSTLASVTESSKSETDTTTLTLPTFDALYQKTNGAQGDFISTGSNWLSPEGFADYGSMTDIGTRLVDINGDGYPDIVRFYGNPGVASVQTIYLNNTVNGWTLDTAFDWSDLTLPFTRYSSFGSSARNDLGTRFADVNGDGLIDVITAHKGNTTPEDIKKVYINTGTAWEEDPSWVVPVYFTRFYSNRIWDTGVRIGDINGDRLPDLVESYLVYGQPLYTTVYLNTGSGWEVSSNWVMPEPFSLCYSCGADDLGTYLIDINNDGLDDVVRGYNVNNDATSTVHKAYINTGSGWKYESSWQVPTFINQSATVKDQGYRFADVNGDGLVDIIWARSSLSERRIFLNNGKDWVYVVDQWGPRNAFVTSSGPTGARIADYNADGIPDIVESYDSTPDTPGGDPGATYTNGRKLADKPTLFTKPEGGEMAFTFKTANQLKSATSSLLNPKLPYTMPVLSSVAFNPVNGTSWSTDYEYTGGQLWFDTNRLTDRRFAGFSTITASTTLGKQKSFYHQGNGTDSANGEYQDDYSKIGLEYKKQVTDHSNSVYDQTLTKWETASTSSSSANVYKSRDLFRSYDGDNDTKDRATEYTYTSYGNLAVKTDWGDVTGNSDGTFSDTGTDKRTTQYGYATNTTAYIVGLPSSEVVYDQNSVKVRESRSYYDSQSLGAVTKGNQTKNEQWVTGSSYASSTKAYNTYGLVTNEIDTRGKATTYAYSTNTYNLYPATSTNALSQSTRYTYDYSSGKVATTTDPNNLASMIIYDGFDRIIEERIPDPNSGALVTKATYAFYDGKGTSSVLTTNYRSGTSTTGEYLYLDGFGREIQKRTQAEDVNVYTVKDTIYGPNGLISKYSLPYFNSGSSRTIGTAPADLLVTQQYDPLGRIISSANVVGTTTTSRDQRKETVTDSLGKIKDFTYDAYSRLVKVTEYNSASTYDTNYEWDHNNNLTKITDALGNVRNLTYDGLSRRTSMQDLHATADATFGTWTFNYDLMGNLTSRIDPKSQTVNYTYDNLNRPLTENFTGSSGVEVTYVYDSCTRGIGRLCSAVVRNVATTTYVYTHLGLVGTTTRTVGGVSYVIKQTYDRLGNLLNTIYPNGSEVRYTYNAQNLPETLEQRVSGGAWKAVIDDLDYGPHGLVTYEEHANGVYTENTYDENQLYRLKRKLTTRLGTGGNPELSALDEVSAVGEFGLIDATTLFTDNLPVGPQEILLEESITTTDEVIAPVSFEVPIEIVASTTEFQDPAQLATSTVVAEPIAVETLPPSQRGLMLRPNTLRAQRVEIFDDGVDENGNAKKRIRMYAEPLSVFSEPLQEVTTEEYIDVQKSLTSVRIEKKTGQPVLSFRGNDGVPIDIDTYGVGVAGVNADRTIFKDSPGSYVLQDVLPDGNLEITIDDTAVTKNILYAKPPQGAGTTHDVTFVLSRAGGLDMLINNQELSKQGLITSNEAVTLTANGIVVGYIRPPRATQSSSEYSLPLLIDVTYEYRDGVILATKHIPRWWLETASYPVRADLTFTTFGGTGDGTVDGMQSSNWDVTHDSTIGMNTDYMSNEINVLIRVADNGISYDIYRGFLVFDTSNIPDNAIITGATTSIYIQGIHNQDNDASAYIGLYQGNQASPSMIVADDVDQCGTINNPIPGAQTYDIDTISLNTYLNIPLNATGTSWISKTAPTKLCLREGHDVDDIPINGGAYTYSGIRVYSTDTVGTSNDPYIEVAYTDPGTTTPPTANAISDLIYTYDAVGNITSITDLTVATSAKSTVYQYDDLYRLLTVATTTPTVTYYTSLPLPVIIIGTTTPYRTWTYNALGNITTASNLGTYTYAGTGYANPHAPTTINGVTQSYDNNGNLLTGHGMTNTWNYRNELTKVASGTASTTYTYDHTGSRVEKKTATSTVRYLAPDYEVTLEGATTTNTRQLSLNAELVATIDEVGSSSTQYQIHRDHLGSTIRATNASGTPVHTLSYHPYGDILSEVKTTGFKEKNQYIGQEYDAESDLSYLNARYLKSTRGQFLSQDPVFWEVGVTKDGVAVLLNPQVQNSYSYAGNNPVVNKDPTGRFWWVGFYDWSGYEGVEGMTMKAGEVLGGHSRAINVMRQNQGSINSASSKYGVDPRLTNAIIYEEQSHLTPDEVFGREQFFPKVGKGGVGVMQVSGLVGKEYGNYSKEELARNPNKNIAAGTAYIGSMNTANPAAVGQIYNGSVAYGQRIQSQINNPNYNTNIAVYGLQRIVNSLKTLVSTLKKKQN